MSRSETVGTTVPIPAFVNPDAGSAARARAALRADPRFVVRDLAPARIADAVREEIRHGTRRLLISGGDGTVCSSLGAAAGTALEIAVFPGGTLNHFARDLGLPFDDPAEVLDIAANGRAQPVDLGAVNGHVILNTSCVGVYVDFVRQREYLEQRVPYRPASVAAAIDVWHDPQAFDVELITPDGTHHRLRTPLVFVGIQERVLDRSGLGTRRPGGARALHILVVKAQAEHARARIHALALKAAARGIEELISDDEIECYLTTGAVVALPNHTDTIAIDGELLEVTSPLTYELVRGAARVVHP